jgi:hypothetical protein
MKKLFLLVFCALSVTTTLSAQKFEIKGVIQDTMNVKNIAYASVSAMRKSDSVLVKSVRTNQLGQFRMVVPKPEKYIVMASHSSYIDYVEEIEVNESKPSVDLGVIPFTQRGQFLKEVVIRSAAGIKIKGDTLEFLADSFKVKQGATVEDLLKVLPGLQVNKNGEITAMGEKVQKVLVDGEEFFGDDPTIATQNLQSRIVDKVQVFDKKSDQAQFTGFDDGNTEKTINLKLKKGMNKGEFGKVEASGGPNDRWQNQAMLNVFRDKEKFSLYGLMSSLGKTGLGWEDRNAYTGQAENMVMNEDGFMTMTRGGDDDNNWGNQIPEGITKAWVGGAHYSNRWNNNKEHANMSYSFGRINKVTREVERSENLFPQNRFQGYDSSESFNSRNQHRLSGKYDFAIDTNTTIYYNFSGRLSFVDNESYNLSKNKTYTEQPISSSERDNSTRSTNTSANNSITVNRKLKKTGRTVSFNANYDYRKNESAGTLIGENDYNIPGTPLLEVLDQQKQTIGVNNAAGAGITYTEPLHKKLLMKLSYAINTDRNNSLKLTRVKNNNGEFDTQIDSLSNDFHSIINSHTGGLEFKFNEKKYSITMGSRIRWSDFLQEDIIRNYQYNYSRINLFPTVRYEYKFSQFSRLTTNYNGNTTQPSIQQIQPIQDNSNPLNLVIGNPNLKMGYNQSISVNFFNYKVLSSRSIYLGGWASNQFNMVGVNRSFDELGRTITEYVNLNGYYSVDAWGGWNGKIKKTNFEAKVNMNLGYAQNPNIVNNVKATTKTTSFSITPGITYSKEDKWYASAEFGVQRNTSNTSQQNARNIKFVSLNPQFSLIRYIGNLELGTDGEYIYNPPVDPYPNKFERFVWNSYASYKLLPNKNLELRASVHDMLNQNKGYERSSDNNMNSERNFLTLGRYWLIGAIYNFRHGAMAEAKGAPGRMPAGGRRMRVTHRR